VTAVVTPTAQRDKLEQQFVADVIIGKVMDDARLA
jgi:hypothetical protein